MYQGPTFAGLLIVVNLPNLPKWHINLPTNLTNLYKTFFDLYSLANSWKPVEDITRYCDIPYFG